MFDTQSLIKYLLEGLAIATVAYVIPKQRLDPLEIAILSLIAASTFAILDIFSPLTALGSRQGAGFAVGWRMVGGGPYPGMEGFADPEGYNGQENYQDPAPADGQVIDNQISAEAFDDKPYEGYDDYANPQEGFDGSSEVCKMGDGGCEYASGISDDKKSEFVCHKDGSDCKQMEACRKDSDKCSFAEHAEDDLKAMKGDVGNRSCTLKDGKCRLAKKEGFVGYENFVGDAESIQGFEGFSKTF